MARKKKYVPKAFESGKAGDVSANIYASMIQSRVWSNLTNNARVLYVYMKLQYYGQKTIPDREQECFYFNKAMFIKTYQLYKNVNQFYKDKKLLIDNGFIETVENGKTTRTKSIYKLSSKWREI